MELYILDDQFRRVEVFEKYESLIWAERFNSLGDFRLTVQATDENRKILMEGVRLALRGSWRVMEIETVQDSTDSEGKAILTATGPSLEYLLTQRVVRYSLSDTLDTKWVISDTAPATIARSVFENICVLGLLSSNDVIPYINQDSTFFPTDTIDEPTDLIDYEMEPMTLYDAEKRLCDVYDMGFRLIRNYDESELWFDIYMGSDRTSQQTDYPAVIFSQGLDNLQNTSQLTTKTQYKNVAIVISPVGVRTVYALDVDSSVAGFDRRVMVVTASDITDASSSVANARMDQRGAEALGQARKFSGFDGEINQNAQYVYQVDYFLGDLVELRNTLGTKTVVKVTEQIFVSDKEGDRSYPTLEIRRFVTPGSWDDAAPDLVWDSAPGGSTWDDGL